MGLTAAVGSNAPSVGSLSLYSAIGIGIGGIFVTALVAYLLAYLEVVKASEREMRRLRVLLVATSVPLEFVFIGIITFQSLSVLGYL